LRSLYHESDLLVAECLRSGLFDGLSVGEVAGLASVFTFETRGPGTPPAPWFPPGPLRERFADLEHTIEDEDITGGDFVRNVKQLIDLLRQMGDVAGDEGTAARCRQAADAVFRGVEAASSVVT
jgi:ATP-dependent RNA helicase HelY